MPFGIGRMNSFRVFSISLCDYDRDLIDTAYAAMPENFVIILYDESEFSECQKNWYCF